jgi:hypothetical protein
MKELCDEETLDAWSVSKFMGELEGKVDIWSVSRFMSEFEEMVDDRSASQFIWDEADGEKLELVR